MSSAKREKFGRITKQQLQYYMQFCKQHPEINRVKTESCDKSDTDQIYKLWTQLVDRLNELQGPTQSVKLWKETLTHWKTQVRTRMRRYQNQAGRNIFTKSNHGLQDPLLLNSTEVSKSTTIPHQVSEIKAEVNVDDNNADNDSSTSGSSIPSSFAHITRSHKRNMNTKALKMNYPDICSTIVKTLEARREREEVLFTNQLNLISNLNETLTLMTRVLQKIDRKLNNS